MIYNQFSIYLLRFFYLYTIQDHEEPWSWFSPLFRKTMFALRFTSEQTILQALVCRYGKTFIDSVENILFYLLSSDTTIYSSVMII